MILLNGTRIVVDLDEVCCSMIPAWLDLYNDEFHDNLTIDDIHTYDIHKYVKCGTEIYDLLEAPHFYSHLPLVPGTKEILNWAKEYFNLIICTSRAAYAHEDTMSWIDRNLPMVDSENVVFTKKKSLVNGDILIDDCPRHLEEWCGVPVVFGNMPYNRHLTHMTQASNWLAVEDLLKQLL